MEREELLKEMKDRLQALYGERLKGVILFGSEARGDAGPDSDIDVLVLLRGPVDYARELPAVIEALYSMTLDLGRPVTPKVVDAEDYETFDCPLFRNVRREGIRA